MAYLSISYGFNFSITNKIIKRSGMDTNEFDDFICKGISESDIKQLIRTSGSSHTYKNVCMYIDDDHSPEKQFCQIGFQLECDSFNEDNPVGSYSVFDPQYQSNLPTFDVIKVKRFMEKMLKDLNFEVSISDIDLKINHLSVCYFS